MYCEVAIHPVGQHSPIIAPSAAISISDSSLKITRLRKKLLSQVKEDSWL